MSLSNLPEVADTQILHHDFFQLRKERLRIPHQKDYDYYVLEASPFAVMVLATTHTKEYVLNWEYRHPIRKVLLSCPGGVMHENETPLNCAKRELLEETGYTAEKFELIGEAYPFPGICTQKTYYILAYDAILSGSKTLEPAEFIETELFSAEKLQKALTNNTPVDGLLLAALLFAKQK